MKRVFVIVLTFFIALSFTAISFAEEASVYDSVRDRIISVYSYLAGTNTITIEVSDPSGALIDAADLALPNNPEIVTADSIDLDFSLSYNPTTAQAYISYTNTSAVHVVSVMDLTPVGAPVLFVDPTALNFGSVTIGNSPTLNVIVQNTGDGTINVTSVTGPSAPYGMTNGCNGAALLGQQQCGITIQFTPTAQGSFPDTLQINTSAGNQTVNITGTGQAAPTPQISVSPTNVNFGTVNVGSSTTSNVQVQNIGTADLNVTFVGSFTPSQFSLNSNGCTSPVTPGNICNISVRFTPTAGTTYNGSFQINSDGGNQSVTLNGTGQVVGGGNIDLDPTYIRARAPYLTYIYRGTTRVFDYKVRNNGNDPSGTIRIKAYYSMEDKVLDGSDIEIANFTISSIAGGTESSLVLSTSTPWNIQVHSIYYLILVVDPDDTIQETNENNNTIDHGGFVKG